MSYKMYVRPHLDYGDVIYHNQRENLLDMLEQVQCKAAIVVSGCWQGTIQGCHCIIWLLTRYNTRLPLYYLVVDKVQYKAAIVVSGCW